MNIVTNLFGFVLVLGLLIFAHETGHFLVAKAFGVRVMVFSFGFGQRLFGFRRGDTDYRVSLIPLGGYVRMAGDNPEESRPGDPDEFLARPKWQRFLILLAGPFVNLLIAIVFMAAISMVGTETLVLRPIIGEVSAGKPAARAGLQPGDRIVSIDGDPINDFDDLRMMVSMHADTPLHVDYLRNSIRLSTILTPERQSTDYGPIGFAGVRPWIEPVIGQARPGSPAARAGLRGGDRIVAAEGVAVRDLTQLEPVFNKVRGGPVALDVARGAETLRLVLPAVPANSQELYRGILPPTVFRQLGPVAALQDSVTQNWKMLRYMMVTLERLVRGQGSVKEFSGPISIARFSGEALRRGWLDVLAFMALMSLELGIMNLLPVPVLDGGHIAILVLEGAARRDFSIRVKERITQIGFAVLAALMIVVIYNDVITNVLLLRKG